MGEEWVRMKAIKNKIIPCLISLLPFLVLFFITKAWFPEAYLLKWMVNHYYLGLWLIAASISFFHKRLAYVISFGNFAAVILGQVIGDRIRAYNISTITPDMDAGKTAMLHGHPGFEIWLMMLVLTVAIFLIAGKVKHHIDLKKRYKTD